MKKVILSGMRPTGKLHLGHLLGALSNWVKLQDAYECFFMAADWHALLSEYKNPAVINEFLADNIIDWLSCGIDPNKSTIFVQSQVPYHTELALILGAITPLSWLERCPTYKEQLNELEAKEITTYGFLGYPVLQAADILLYKAAAVPVGQDQLPHLELTREITRRFNHLYGEVLVEPQPLLTATPKILGIDGRKMSKSYDNFIALSEAPEKIREKVLAMFTDPQRIKRTDPGRPEICNVCSYYEIFTPEMPAQVKDECRHAQIGCREDKKRLAEILVNYLAPLREKRAALLKDKNIVNAVLEDGAKKARAIAAATLEQARQAMKL